MIAVFNLQSSENLIATDLKMFIPFLWDNAFKAFQFDVLYHYMDLNVEIFIG